MSGPSVPAETVLQGLRERGPDAYRAGRAVDTWDANCPSCNSGLDGRRTLHVSQNGVGARLRCDSGCDQAAILAELGLTGDAPAAPTTGAGFRILTAAELAALPEPTFLLDSLLPANGFTVLFGPSGSGKSFLALDWAMCVATGVPWYGRVATPGPVLFIAAEGAYGLHRRVMAWCEERERSAPDRLRFLPDAVNFLELAQVQRAADAIAALPEKPALIVVDTLARCMVGGDENAARDVGMFIAAVDTLRAQIGAAALVIHHTGKNGDDERGSSALRGAADMSHGLKPDGAGLVLECRKAKDSEPNPPMELHLATVAKSCVIRLGTNQADMAPAEVQILTAVSTSFGTTEVTASSIKDAADVPKSSFYRALRSLVTRGHLTEVGTERRRLYQLTTQGTAALVPTSPNPSHGTSAVVPSHPSPYREGGTNGTNWDADELQALVDAA